MAPFRIKHVIYVIRPAYFCKQIAIIPALAQESYLYVIALEYREKCFRFT